MATLNPKNISAQLAFRARGNPPSTQPAAAISNCFPGLEFDFRNVWKNLFVGIELHEAGLGSGGHRVLAVTAGSPAAAAGVAVFDRLVSVAGRPVEFRQVLPSGPSDISAIELANALAHIVTQAGVAVPCDFQKDNGTRVTASLVVRPVFDGAAIAETLAEPGALTQSLCSPWQADYRECGCYYWAASRPDFVNVQPPDAAGNSAGQDWMQKNRDAGAPYQQDAGGFSPNHVTYDDLYGEWEKHLKFIIGGKDAE
jgi:hypothetical protein